jgi:hypothetical protein
MTYIYYVDGDKFKTKNYNSIPFSKVSSLNEETPAIEGLSDNYKLWCLKGWTPHRLTGPAYINTNGVKEYWLNGERYNNIKEWIKNHPNPDLYFDTIGLNATERVLWFLQN